MGLYSKAQPLYEKALQIRQKTLGLEHLNTAQSLNNLGVLYYHLKEYDKALPLFERALAIREKAAGPEHPDTAATLNNLGLLYKDMGTPDKALNFYQQALQIREKALGPDHADTIATINNLAAFYADSGELAKAASLYERVVKSKEKTPGPDHPDTAAAMIKLAQVYQGLGEYDKAVSLAGKALKIREKALGAENPDTIASLNGLAALYTGMGAYEKSIPLYERVVQIREKTPEPNNPDIAVSLNYLALAYQGLGEYDKALELYNRSLKIKETASESEQSDTARTLVNLASLYQAMGAYEKAQSLYERAIKIRENTPGTDPPDTAGALDSLANLYVTMGLYDKALPLYQRAAKIYESKGPTNLNTGTSLQKVANLYQIMGDTDKALPLLEQSAKIFAKNLGPNHPDTASVLLNLGRIQLAKNAPDKAGEYFKQIKAKDALVNVALSRGHAEDAWQLLDGLTPPTASTPATQVGWNTRKGQALAGVGRLPEAAVALWQAVQGSEKRPFKSLIQARILQEEDYLRPYRQLAEVLAKLAQNGKGLPPELQEFGPSPQAAALAMAEATKSREILAELAGAPRAPRRLELSPELRQREAVLQFHLAAEEAQWDRAVAGGQEGLKEVISKRRSLNITYEDLLQDLRQTQPLYAAFYYPQPTPIKDLPLTENEVIVEYALGEDAGTIFVVRRDGVQYMYPLPLGRKALEAGVREFLEPLLHGRSEEFSVKKGEELYDLLLTKPLATISPSEQVIIVSDGILGLLPFESLVMAAGRNPETSTFVGDQRSLLYYPAITVLIQQRGRAAGPNTRPLLALANPFYEVPEKDSEVDKPQKVKKSDGAVAEDPPADQKKKSKSLDPTEKQEKFVPLPGYLALAANLAWGPVSHGPKGNQGILYPPLPATEPEVREIAKIFGVSCEPPDVLLGRQANKAQLQQAALRDCRYLHFATHAELTDRIQGLLSPFILLGQGKKDASDDSFLTLSDIVDLDLGAHLVVLANGHAGWGQALMGQGVINLARAFLYAGARSALINLWDSKPEITKEFFVKFYGYLKEGKSRGEALRLARNDVRLTHPDPVFWAGYVLYGEGDS